MMCEQGPDSNEAENRDQTGEHYEGNLHGVDAFEYLLARYQLGVQEGTTQPLKFDPRKHNGPGEVEAGAEPPTERSGGGGGDGEPERSVPPLLERERKTSGANSGRASSPPEQSGEVLYEVVKCRCKCWYCLDCCESMGIGLQRRITPIVENHFQSVMMLTLTIDPTLFKTPREALEYVKEKNAISELMRTLRNAGVLHSNRWFYVVEFQKDTEQAHWHILCDASYIPKELIQDRWDKFRPEWAGPKPDNRPGLGMVRFSAPKFKSKIHAVRYATKYLTKRPEHGFPDWVLDCEKYVHRYSVSRGRYGFWSNGDDDEGTEAPEIVADFEEEETDPEGYMKEVLAERRDEGLARSTIRERLEKCGRQACVIGREAIEYGDGSRDCVTRFLGQLKFMSFQDVKEFLGFGAFDMRAIPIRQDDIKRLRIEDARRKMEFRLGLIEGLERTQDEYDRNEDFWQDEEDAAGVFDAFEDGASSVYQRPFTRQAA